MAFITSKVTQFTSPSGSWNLTVPWTEVPSAVISDGKSIKMVVGGPGTAVGVGVTVAVGVCVGVEVKVAVGGTDVAVAVGVAVGVTVGIAVGLTVGVAVEVGVYVDVGGSGVAVGNARSNASIWTFSASAAHCSHSSSLIDSGGLGGCPDSAVAC